MAESSQSQLRMELLFSAMQGNVPEVRRLAALGVNVNGNMEFLHGTRPLHLAARGGHVEAVVTLVELGADVNPQGFHGLSPLHEAVGATLLGPDGEPDESLLPRLVLTVASLLQHGADANVLDDFGGSPLHYAVRRRGLVKVVAKLLEHAADVHGGGGQSPLHIALEVGDVETVATLLEHGADVHVLDANGDSPLHHAANEGHVEAVVALVEHGADVNVQAAGATPLHYAVQAGHAQVVDTLARLGADVNNAWNGWRPLHDAVDLGHVEVVATLLQHGADVHAVDDRGFYVLHLANTAATAMLLLGAGADIHRRTEQGDTPLSYNIYYCRAPVVRTLVLAGAHPEASDSEWWTTLFVGAITGDEAALTELIAASWELTWRMNQNGHFARTAVQEAELLPPCAGRQEVLAALTVPPP